MQTHARRGCMLQLLLLSAWWEALRVLLSVVRVLTLRP